ncbi:MAG TPA: FliH/SctL family protein, partial [Polyangiales bacterium]
MRPLFFRRVEEGADEATQADRPNWLAPRELAIRPAFVEEERAPIRLPAPAAAPPPEPEPEPEQGLNSHGSGAAFPPVMSAPQGSLQGYGVEQPLPRHSSLPPRKSVYPPQVTISRYPPPPAPPVPDLRPTAEQEAFAQAALELASLRGRVLSNVENELLSLAVHIAQAIIEREVKIDPTVHVTLARTAVLALGDTQSARLRVSRAAYRAISELYGEAAIDVEGVRVEVSMDA